MGGQRFSLRSLTAIPHIERSTGTRGPRLPGDRPSSVWPEHYAGSRHHYPGGYAASRPAAWNAIGADSPAPWNLMIAGLGTSQERLAVVALRPAHLVVTGHLLGSRSLAVADLAARYAPGPARPRAGSCHERRPGGAPILVAPARRPWRGRQQVLDAPRSAVRRGLHGDPVCTVIRPAR
jgi:hypothetical protein